LTDPLSQRPVPLLTPELPGTSGMIRVAEEDFQVEELPLYQASGVGEHLYLTVEKRGRTTPEVAREIARGLGAAEREVGTAGLKDKRAVTVQRISVKTKAPAEEALRLSGPGYRVLAAARHGNKLRPGHLRGNRFRIVVRGVQASALARAEAIAARLREIGAANLFGPQRFGKSGDNAALGRGLLLRETQVRDRFLRRMALSALHQKGRRGESTDREFFVAFAQSWCTNYRPEAARLQAQVNPHSTAQWRVNGPVSDNADFAKTFSCKAGTPMNPEKKCVVW